MMNFTQSKSLLAENTTNVAPPLQSEISLSGAMLRQYISSAIRSLTLVQHFYIRQRIAHFPGSRQARKYFSGKFVILKFSSPLRHFDELCKLNTLCTLKLHQMSSINTLLNAQHSCQEIKSSLTANAHTQQKN